MSASRRGETQMKDHYFISYSSADGKDFAMRLTDRLIGGPPSYAAWLDVRELRASSDWDRQVRDAIRESQALLFVMTADSVRDDSRCKDEWVWALRHKKPIVPLKFVSKAELPFQLGARQYIDFTVGFDVGLARLRDEIDRLRSPDGALQELRLRLADAEREMPRARDEGERMRIVQDMEVLQARIAEQERVVADPTGATEAATIRIAADLERQRNPKRLRPRTVRQTKIVNQLPVAVPTYFQDRNAETELLAEFLRAKDTRMATVVGRGGVGKTATVCRLLRGMEIGRLPDGLDEASGELALHGVVYLRTPSAHPVSFANLFTDLCQLLPAKTAEPLLRRYRDPHETPGGLMFALLEVFSTGRWVVLLDNFEDKVDPVTNAVTENALDEALRTMLSAPEHFVKVIITTRIVPQPLLLHQPGVQQRIDLDDGLPSPFAERLLRARDPDGRLGLKSARMKQLSQARERTRGYPRALEALAGILSADRNSTLSELLDQTTHLPENVVTALVGEAFLRLDPLAQQVMQTLAIFPVPVPAVAVDFLMQPFQSAINAAPVLSRLVNMQFVRRDADCYYLHQIDRDYVLGRIPEGERHRPRNRSTAIHRDCATWPRRRLLRPNAKTAGGMENSR